MSANSEAGDHLDEIYDWIDQIKFSRPKRNIARDFSDGVLMAELLKRYYPKHVDVHNYVAGNSIAKKTDNWSTLNRKVLSKIDIRLGKEAINQLASSQPGVIEKVLTDLRVKILKDSERDRELLYFGHEDSKVSIETVKSVLNDELANKTVPRHIFTRLKQELQEKNDTISTLQQKISHLESIMKLKDQRIDDLTLQITRLPVERNVAMPHPHVIGNGISKRVSKLS
ncbi:PREDICTED: sperm flagellar protein 1-like [Trachymyrmex cornetzi]|uniref:Sperm flagellar protein 1 n=1 Tax=Trachymyrmex cornetzi TaxID=471704 RepID=A0A195ENB6_9HYME|nr:PREDICTED: sperm flagellar protein 1-like [Trachymyrmex cornetzi]KYN29678.1 Sperm flagellar protein 1 [Trachymyrmex cornetzi]